MTVPWPSRLRGTVRLHPLALTRHVELLDAHRRHQWWPVAPCARIEAAFERPALRWRGQGYLDSNAGDEPLEQGFVAWDWARASHGRGTTILYDAVRRDGSDLSLALHVDDTGRVEPFAAPPRANLPTTLWRVPRATRSEPAHPARLVATLEDTPFYARSLVRLSVRGAAVTAVHESLSLDRFAAAWVRLLLPFRMPRELA